MNLLLGTDVHMAQFSSATEPSRPKAIFIGSALKMPARLLNVFQAEFSDFEFLRMTALKDLAVAQSLGTEIELLVVDEDLAQAFLGAFEAYAKELADTPIAIAYRNADNARDIISEFTDPLNGKPLGFLPLNVQMEVWVSAMRLILCGEIFYPQELLQDQPPSILTSDDVADVQLTPREWEVLELVSQGKQNKIIALELELSEHTVKLHIHNLLQKLEVSNRTGAANWYTSRKAQLNS